MPIFSKPIRDRASQLKPSFVDRIRVGNVVPVISHEALIDLVFGSHQKLVNRYADFIEYPFPGPRDIREMAKFRSITQEKTDWDLKHEYLTLVKSHVYFLAEEEGADKEILKEAEVQVDNLGVTAFARILNYPRITVPEEDPLLILANLPLPVYITTIPFGFIEYALKEAGKQPCSEFFRWRPSLDTEPSVFTDRSYTPSAYAPLVYHLFGVDSRADSLILTEDDLMQFLVAAAQGQGKDTDRVPSRVRQAVLDSALVLLGFNMTGRIFRTLFWGLLKQTGRTDKGIFTVQVRPEAEEEKYVKGYLKEARFDVFWGDMRAYAIELHQMWKG